MVVYPNRYQAEKACIKGKEVVVKVDGGYAVMTISKYQIWKHQK